MIGDAFIGCTSIGRAFIDDASIHPRLKRNIQESTGELQ
jgi:hypothetical protein